MEKRRWAGRKKKAAPDNPNVERVKDIIGCVVIAGISFLYWLVMLLFASLVLLNYWHVKFDQLVDYSIVLMVVTTVIYVISLVRRRKKEHRIAKYMAE